MQKTITVGGKEMKFEANLGTSKLYQKLTGKNLFTEMMEYAKGMKREEIIDLFTDLAFVMNVQAETDNIKDMINKMNEDVVLEWSFNVGTEDLTPEFFNEIASLWNQTNKTNSESKNA